MPDRLVRDEILRSERYWTVSIEAQRLFLHLLLCVDDTARFSGKNYTIRSACYPGHAIEPAKVERLLAELQDVDLIRLYTEGEERFVFVPRFRQRLRFVNSRYPAPPKEISDISIEKTVSSLTQDGLKPDSSLTQDGRREEKRSEVKRSEVKRREEKRSTPKVARSAVALQADAPLSEYRIPLNDATEFAVPLPLVTEWESLFPDVDIPNTLRQIRAWNLANPTRRKTKTGIVKHITNWLAKEQNA